MTPQARKRAPVLPKIERKIAVFFGINDYQDKLIPPLESAVPDVKFSELDTVDAATGLSKASSAPGTHVTPGRPRPTASATRSASPAGTTTVADTDSGKTVTLRSGQLLKVHLSNGTWNPPVSSAPGVVGRQSFTGGYPTSAPVDAVFQAVASGPADLTATFDAACFHTSPRCMMATRLWTVHLLVR